MRTRLVVGVAVGCGIACSGAAGAAPMIVPATQAATMPAAHQTFAVSVYCVIGSLGGTAQNPVNLEQLAATWEVVSKQIKIDKVYIETVRDQTEMVEGSIEPLKKFFTDRGVKVAGGMTLAQNNSGQFTTYDYEKPEDRATIKRLGETAARHFDEVILDDFFFYNTKSDLDIAAKGERSWTDYRVATMREVSKRWLVDPMHAVNAKCQVVIKYPNWYEHFQASGFDLAEEPRIFDGIYAGTETRDPVRTEQHLQPYESYEIIRYFENIKPGGLGGGWVDLNQYNVADRYAEQLWDTVFAKAPQVMLFSWGDLQRPIVEGNRPWAGEKTSFDWGELMKEAAGDPAPRAGRGGRGGGGGGAGVMPSVARVAGYALADVDKVVHQLGKPVGIKSYRPAHGTGEDFLHNYLGMAGLPIEMVAAYPEDAGVVLLTEDARGDADIVKKMKASLAAGHSVVITSGLLKALQGKGIEDICEVACTGNVIPVTSFHVQGGAALANSEMVKPILFPEIEFMTNDAWYVLAGMASGTGYPVLISDRYSKGTLLVLAVPEAAGDLYNLPASALGVIRNSLGAGLPVVLNGETAAGVALFEYDNGTFVVQNFGDEAKGVGVGVTGGRVLKNLLTGEEVPAAAAGGRAGRGGGGRGGVQRTALDVKVPAHSWAAYSVGN